MKLDVNIDVRHLTRIEGHGNIKIRIEGGQLREARWEVVETPRFFEALLQGKSWRAAALLTSRICGICSIGHSLASVRASEAAFGLEIPPAAAQLRLLAKHGETLQSHLLHLLFLAAPDFLGLPSAIPLLETKPEIFELAARLKNLANRLCDAVAGRTTHPVSIQVGGMRASWLRCARSCAPRSTTCARWWACSAASRSRISSVRPSSSPCRARAPTRGSAGG